MHGDGKSHPETFPTCPRGFAAAATRCGLKASGNIDLALIRADAPASAAALFTTNRLRAAPIDLSAEHLAQSGGRARGLIINAGIANAATGTAGAEAARRSAAATAAALSCPVQEILCNSTGVIGVQLPADRITAALPGLAAACTPAGLADAARAIMTTDTRPKVAEAAITHEKRRAKVVGIAKGAGMIHPNLATMIVVILTDAAVPPADLRSILVAACERSFHRISIDGDTSTNDSVFALASGAAGAFPRPAVADAITRVARDLATQIARDGEGASKLLRVIVTGAATAADALAVARTVAMSMLVRTAVAGGDPNWGRIVAAAGRSGADVDPRTMTVTAGGVPLYVKGAPAPTPRDRAARAFAGPDVEITLDLGRGAATDEFLTCDLTEGYIRVNALYTT